MLSILIPIYNEDITSLVKDLVQQGRGLVAFEILCFDDGSALAFDRKNQLLDLIPEVKFKRMEKNLGRSKIRNVLADAAQGDYLLFMDCDSKVVRADYLKKYINSLDENTLLYGGRCYDSKQPENPNHLLHWNYGIQREQQSAELRKKKAYHSFMTNNFLIPTIHFHQIRFDESLTQYGHEDTLFGMALREMAIPILHLDNPLEHTGLETAEVFLSKTKKAIENLHQLNNAGKNIETKLTSAHSFLRNSKLDGLFLKLFSYSEQDIYNKLLSGKNSLRLFDFYKLGSLIKIAQRKK